MPQAFIVVEQQKKGAREVCSRRGAKRGPANIRWVTPGLPVTIRRETASPPQSEAVNPSASTADSLTAPPCAAWAAAHSRARLRREPSWRLNWRPDSLTRCASACSRNPPMRTCMRARGCNGEAFCKGWVSGRAAGRCWHGGADSPRNRAVPARQAQQVRARSRTPTHGTNSRSSAHGGHAIRAAIRVYPCLSVPLPCGSAHTLPARRQAAPSQPTTPAMVRQGRAPHLSSLTVSVRPSSSVPWNFSMAACASCALQKRTRPYPCRRASPAVSALLAQTGSAEGRDRQCWSFAAPGHASVAVETECSVCTASQQRKHFAKHHAGCRRLPHQERAPC